MGNLVTATDVEQQKPDMTAAEVAAGSVTLGGDELNLFVGANLAGRYTEVGSSLKNILRNLQRKSNPTPASDEFAYGRVTIDSFGKASLELETSASAPTITENDVLIAYGDLFQATAGQAIATSGRKALEVYAETFARKGL